jgi:hypothetical protein
LSISREVTFFVAWVAFTFFVAWVALYDGDYYELINLLLSPFLMVGKGGGDIYWLFLFVKGLISVVTL